MNERSIMYKIDRFHILRDEEAKNFVIINLVLSNADASPSTGQHHLFLQFQDDDDAAREFAKIYHRLVQGDWRRIRELLDLD